ncbi:MAG: sigma-70 family RNA polymerase sigma factor [Bacteroidales bacterium]|nr:sigma-70 family RNA polymerase sigma factor [Bacteroidales bacterium]
MKESGSNLIEQAMAYDQVMHQYAYSLTKNEEDANDLVQDTYEKVIKFSSSFNDSTNLKAWVFTIMKNSFINTYRRKQRCKIIFDQTEDLHYLNNTVSNPSDAADIHYYVSDISQHILSKNEEQRKPFEMYMEGYKYQEIADMLNLSIGTVKSRIFFIRQKLMSELEDYVTPTFPRTA